jgi:type VI secretion system protein ImpF
MALRSDRTPIVPSVLDRLTAEPHTRTIGSSRPQSLSGLYRALQRDLEFLLNTRREHELIPRSYRESASSVLNFGFPDLLVYCLRLPSDQNRVCREIENAIRIFEPRLTGVTATLSGWDEVKPVLRFRVEAILKVEPAREPVVFDTELRIESGNFILRGRPR